MKDWKTFKKELLCNKKVASEYKKLEPRYALVSQLIEKRINKGITQAQLAKKIGTKQSAIARLESGNINPSLSFLDKVSQALGARLVVQIR